jgi:hypothetical protein
MSERLQFEHHPDADQIGAFVEHALPAHEQEQMLNHLAVCQECRAIVALSLPSAEPAKTLVAPARKPWWPGWTLAWPALAAATALAVFIVYVYHAKSSPGSVVPTQEAELHQAAPLEMPMTTPVGIPEPPPPRSTKHDRPSAIATSGAAVSLPRKDEQVTVAADVLAVQADSNTVSTLANRDQTASVKMNKESAPPAESTQKEVSTLITSQQISKLATENRNFSSLAALGLGVSKNKAGTTGNPTKTGATGDANAATASSSVASLNNEPEFQSQHLKHRLPSRLPVLSMAVHGRQIIAVDTHNTVFLSADAGKRWKSIRAPWPGRAVLVELVSAETIVSKPATWAFTAEEHIAPPASSPAPNPAPAQAPVSNPASTGEQASSLTGRVTDQTGAVISGASVVVRNIETGAARSDETDRSGLYAINALAPGTYGVKVIARGFETFYQASVPVAASAQTVVDVRLTVGAETQTVTVQADALAVQTDSNVVSTLIGPDQTPPVFEITTDSLDHWTSTDGITWKRK